MNQAEVTRVLIVEDNPVDVKLLTYALKSVEDWTLETTVARDGEEAIDFLLDPQIEKPDLVILDLNLPKRDGLEVLQVLRITNHLYGLPVIIFSSSPEDVIKNRLHDSHLKAEAYLTKPNGIDAFLAIGPAVRQVYESSRA